MNKQQAHALAEIFSGEAWDSSGSNWLAAYWRGDGKYIVFSSDTVCEYDSEEAFDNASATKTILLASGDEEFWVVFDPTGSVIYRNPDLKTGWRSQEEAAHEAHGFTSRSGDHFFAERMDAV